MSNPDRGGIIYAIGVPGAAMCKIGFTCRTVHARLSDLQAGSPVHLSILAETIIDRQIYRIERAMHALLETDHIYGEWFAVEMDQPSLEALLLRARDVVADKEAMLVKTARKVYRKRSMKPLIDAPPYTRWEPQESLGDCLRRLRQKRGLTQQAFSALCGVPFSTISRIETGKTTVIYLSTLMPLVDTLHVTIDYLLGHRCTAACGGKPDV